MPEKSGAVKAKSFSGALKTKPVRDFIFETIVDASITTSTPCKIVHVAGFRKFSLMGRLREHPREKSALR